MADLGAATLPAFVVDGTLIVGFDRQRVLAAVARALEHDPSENDPSSENGSTSAGGS